MSTTETSAHGGSSWFSADHKAAGKLCLLIAIVALVGAGVLAEILRTQLAQPDLHVLDPKPYRQLLTLHGTFAVFLFLMPAWAGLGFVLVPQQIGSARLAFPRMGAFTAWLFIGAAALLVASAFTHGGPVSGGWALESAPFSRGAAGDAMELWLAGLALAAAATALAGVNIVATALLLRAPGVTTDRVPLFTWSMVVSSSMLLLAVPVLLAGLALAFAEHHYGGAAFDLARGGDPLVWRQLFWFFAHPAFWALVLPAFGVVSEIVPAFAGRPLFRRREVLVALSAAGALAFAGYGAELANDRSVPQGLFQVTGLLVLVPLGLIVLSWLGTLAQGRPNLGVPMLHALGLILVVAVGMAAVALSTAAGNGRFGPTSFWWVGTWHLLLVGGATLGVVTAVCYWAPRLWGRTLSPGLSALQLLLLVGGSLVGFLPMLVLGVQKMFRGTVSYTSADNWGPANLIATAGAYLLALGVLVFVLNVVTSQRRAVAGVDPWGIGALDPAPEEVAV